VPLPNVTVQAYTMKLAGLLTTTFPSAKQISYRSTHHGLYSFTIGALKT